MLFCISQSSSYAGDPRLQRLLPQGGRVGEEIEVQVYCARGGNESIDLLFSRPGIELLELKQLKGNHYRAMLKIASDCPPGLHPVRFVSALGLSDLRTFHVGTLPSVQEIEPNNASEQAQKIEKNVTVFGTVKREDIDQFRIQLEKDEQLSIEVEGLRLGRTFFDPHLTVINDKGEEIAQCDDAPLTRQDPYVSFQAPASGEYTISVREAAYRGDDLCTYRMHVGDFPRPANVFPPGGKPGEQLEVVWLGDQFANDSRIGKQKIQLPATGTMPPNNGTASIFPALELGEGDAKESKIAPSGVPVRIVDLERTIELEPNDSRKQANTCTAPGAVAGIIEKENDHDLFSFHAKKGQVFEVTSFARTLRSPLDPVVRILTAEGKRIAGNDDYQGKPDSYMRFTAPADGNYLLEVRDHLFRGGNNFIYWVEIIPPQPAVEVKVEEFRRYFATTVDVPQGGVTAAMMGVTEKNRNASLKFLLDNLPPGVEAEIPELPKSFRRLPILFRAKPDAKLSASLATFKLSDDPAPKNSIQPLFWQQTWSVRGLNNRPVWSVFEDRLPVSVTKPVPFKLSLIAPKSPIVHNGAKDIKVVAVRDEGFEEAIKVRLLYNPHGVYSNRSRSIPKGKNEAIIPITSNGGGMIQQWPIAVLAETNIGGRVVSASEFVPLRVAKAYLSLAFPTVAVQQGEAVDYVMGVEVSTPFEGEATATLQGLPHGVTTNPIKFTKDAKQLKFPLQTTPQARLGRHRQISCRVVITENGEPVTHNLSRGELRIDPVPKPAKQREQTQAQVSEQSKEGAS
ncbi:MAG: PPC domain-containing protein [Lacipirellulaceae bacterium]